MLLRRAVPNPNQEAFAASPRVMDLPWPPGKPGGLFMEGGDRVDADGIPLNYSTHWQKRISCALRMRITFRFEAIITGIDPQVGHPV